MKKIFLLLIIVLCISGCDVNYEVFYKKPDNILETVNVKFLNSNALLYNDSVEDYAKDMFNGWRASYDLKNYDYRLSLGAETSTIKVSKTHHNLNSLINNSTFNTFFSNINISKNESGNNILILSDYVYAVKNMDDDLYLEENTGESSNLFVVLKSNYRLDTNADEINESLGIYKWIFTPDDYNKTLKVVFSNDFNIIAYLYNLSSVFIALFISIFVIIVCVLVVKSIKRKKINVNKI